MVWLLRSVRGTAASEALIEASCAEASASAALAAR